VVILATGVSTASKAQIAKMIGAIRGARQAESPLEATHVVTETKLKRTPKLLAAIAVARHVVSIEWLRASAKLGEPKKTGAFAVQDRAAESNWGFDLRESLRSSARVLTGYAVALAPGLRADKKIPEDAEVRNIVHAAGGFFVQDLSHRAWTDTTSQHDGRLHNGLLVVADRAQLSPSLTPTKRPASDPRTADIASKRASARRATARIADKKSDSFFDAQDALRALRALPAGLLTGIIEPDALWCALLRKHLDLARDVLPEDLVLLDDDHH